MLLAPLAEVAERLRTRRLSPVELTAAVLARIERLDPALRAFVTVTPERALAAAREAESAIASGRWRGPLHGVPVSLKDLFDVRGVRTSAGSRFLAEHVAQDDSAVAARLEAAGAVLVGKANLHEFAYGTTCDSTIAGAIRNPWKRDAIPGGSSGGSGAAVAAGLGFASIGTDTGGSVRIPAACCGVVGLKPTFGRISRHGLVPLAPSLDHVGPLTRTVHDAALVFAALAGHDPRDPDSLAAPVPDLAQAAGRGVRGLRLGILDTTLESASSEVAAAVGVAAERLRGAGAELRRVSLATLESVRHAAFVMLFAESLATHRARFESEPERFFPDVRARFERALPLSAVDYVAALEARRAGAAEALRALAEVDALVTPTLPTGAAPCGATQVAVDERAVDVAVANTLYTREWNVLGFPALSVPCGFTGDGLPIGMQLVARPCDEATLVRAGAEYQRLTDWHARAPAL
ncbi:MAG: Asp-tRNA(Asn)/Glu-tRNA(Gln) amidotransferase GatCAB subunit A [Proteobacteria bacterium]|nr:MAG: Asp-tRNA(Asn)/Glu-tRNA(Gln) amidotransferase GatCAB subunit A [Pseudomonadota bacterium]